MGIYVWRQPHDKWNKIKIKKSSKKYDVGRKFYLKISHDHWRFVQHHTCNISCLVCHHYTVSSDKLLKLTENWPTAIIFISLLQFFHRPQFFFLRFICEATTTNCGRISIVLARILVLFLFFIFFYQAVLISNQYSTDVFLSWDLMKVCILYVVDSQWVILWHDYYTFNVFKIICVIGALVLINIPILKLESRRD